MNLYVPVTFADIPDRESQEQSLQWYSWAEWCPGMNEGSTCRIWFFPFHWTLLFPIPFRKAGGKVAIFATAVYAKTTPRLCWGRTQCWAVKDPKFRSTSCQSLTCVVTVINLLAVSSYRAFHLVPVSFVNKLVVSWWTAFPYSLIAPWLAPGPIGCLQCKSLALLLGLLTSSWAFLRCSSKISARTKEKQILCFGLKRFCACPAKCIAGWLGPLKNTWSEAAVARGNLQGQYREMHHEQGGT